MNFFAGLKNYRGLKGITQKQLAEAVGVNNTTVSNWEKGIAKPDLDTLVLLSNYFGISLDELVFFGVGREGVSQNTLPTAAPPPDPVAQGRDPNDVKMIAVLERNIATLEKLADAKDHTIKAREDEIAHRKKSEAEKDFQIKRYEDYILSCKCKADDGEPDKTPGSEALDIAQPSDARCTAMGDKCIR